MGRRDPDELRARPLEAKGKYTGIVQAGFPVGLLLANLVFLVSVNLGGDWAWRMPFLASIVLVIVGLIIRSKVPESPVFDEVKDERRHREVADHRGHQDTTGATSCEGIGLRIAETAGYAVSITYMISYLTHQQLADKTQTLVALCIASAIGIFATQAWARLTDRIGRRPLYIWSCAFAVVVRRPDVPAGQHRRVHLHHRHPRDLLRRLPELPGRRPGSLVPGTLPRQDPRLRRLAGLPDLGHGLRLHAVRHHAAVRLPSAGWARHCSSASTPPSACGPPSVTRETWGKRERQLADEADQKHAADR